MLVATIDVAHVYSLMELFVIVVVVVVVVVVLLVLVVEIVLEMSDGQVTAFICFDRVIIVGRPSSFDLANIYTFIAIVLFTVLFEVFIFLFSTCYCGIMTGTYSTASGSSSCSLCPAGTQTYIRQRLFLILIFYGYACSYFYNCQPGMSSF